MAEVAPVSSRLPEPLTRLWCMHHRIRLLAGDDLPEEPRHAAVILSPATGRYHALAVADKNAHEVTGNRGARPEPGQADGTRLSPDGAEVLDRAHDLIISQG